jgi:hypothetical protein
MRNTQVTQPIRLLVTLFLVAVAGCTEHAAPDSPGIPAAIAPPERAAAAPATTTAVPSPAPTPDPPAVAAAAPTQTSPSPAGTSVPPTKTAALRSSSPASAPAAKGGSF